MKHTIVHASDVRFKKWSGGISSEYYIYPEGAVRAEGNYDFVVTSATVELEESTFSDYSGFDRVIMSLTKDYVLIHDDTDSYYLQPFEPHAFTGEQKTVSKGVYRDFNLIMRRDRCSGEMTSLLLAPGSAFYGPKGPDSGRHRIWTLFCAAGAFTYAGDGEPVSVEAGDMLVLDGVTGQETWRCANGGEEDCRIVLCRTELF